MDDCQKKFEELLHWMNFQRRYGRYIDPDTANAWGGWCMCWSYHKTILNEVENLLKVKGRHRPAQAYAQLERAYNDL
jgi:hypothetical protein